MRAGGWRGSWVSRNNHASDNMRLERNAPSSRAVVVHTELIMHLAERELVGFIERGHMLM